MSSTDKLLSGSAKALTFNSLVVEWRKFLQFPFRQRKTQHESDGMTTSKAKPLSNL